MSAKATLEIDGKKFEFPIIRGSENEVSIDIKSLRSSTNGIITLDSGFKNTGSCKSAITFLNGEEGILRYRGYAIEDLAENSNFLEVAFLIIFGELPTEKQFLKFENDIKSQSLLNEEMKDIIDGFPKVIYKKLSTDSNIIINNTNTFIFIKYCMGLNITLSNFKILTKEKINHVETAIIPIAVVSEFTTPKAGSINAVNAVESVHKNVTQRICCTL